MSVISVEDIERDPHTFLRRLEAGESLTVVRDDGPLAEITPISGCAAQVRPYGLCAGQFPVPADFDEPLPDGTLNDLGVTGHTLSETAC
jgi:antitoxin (DNA-binding transcriptional repressor) of toxin-antitoxin stability system